MQQIYVFASEHVQVTDLPVCVSLAVTGPIHSVLVIQTQTNNMNMFVRLTSCLLLSAHWLLLNMSVFYIMFLGTWRKIKLLSRFVV